MQDFSSILYIILFVGIALFLFIYIKRTFKVPKIASICEVSGGVKTGKTTFLVYLAIKTYKRTLRRVKFINFFRRVFKREERELPLLYSNIPLGGIDYVPMTKDLLLHKKRFAYRSVCILSEFSLVADSQLIKDKVLNTELLLFCKLFGHETHGGTCFVDSQCIADCHYSIKRVLSEYFYIHSITKWIPFFVVCRIREDRYSEDNNVINVNDKDVELTLRKVLIPKRTWKKFDSCCYSAFFDDLPVENKTVRHEIGDNLKITDIVTFNPLIEDKVNEFNERLGSSNVKAVS